ncbi:calcium-binding protein [Streptomyces sp. LE64]|uniref:calcium-binding protein n=1 Tax=Streptomyces sp. LE64 TaxID=3448653 RepID=UPI0040437476
MKTRALVALTTGALALTAVTVPAAHAEDRAADPVSPFGSVTTAAAGAPTVSNLRVNGGKDLVVGVSKKTFTITFTAKDARGVANGVAALWKGGPDADRAERILVPPLEQQESDCVTVNRTTSTCTLKIVADPRNLHPNSKFDLANAYAGRWTVAVFALGRDGSEYENQKYGKHSVKRAAKLAANASPEPVRRGANITVTGDLTRANWDTHRYGGFASGAVKLQYKKQGTTTWKTLKTVSADSRGKVRTTTKASADGHYRLSYGGSTTTGGATSAADFIDVR